MSDRIDQPKGVRQGEELDAAKLEAYLVGHVAGLRGPLEIAQFPSGHSNLTYLVRAHGRELVLRRPPFGSKVKSAHDMGREYRILAKLCEVYPPAPRPLAYCEDPAILGAPFYVMDRLRGVILRRSVPDDIILTPELVRRLSESLIDNLAVLHGLDYRTAGLGDLGKPEGYVERQVTGWTKRYRDSQTDPIAAIDAIAAWLAARIPKESGSALIHNDYKYDNLVLDPDDLTRIIGVLDWEMSTLGDPLMDLGTTLAYWVDADDSDPAKALAFGPTMMPGSLTRRMLADRYGEKTGRDVSNILFYYCFALFKNAVVIQQIYYRYQQGLTKDERFAGLVHGVGMLAERAIAASEKGVI